MDPIKNNSFGVPYIADSESDYIKRETKRKIKEGIDKIESIGQANDVFNDYREKENKARILGYDIIAECYKEATEQIRDRYLPLISKSYKEGDIVDKSTIKMKAGGIAVLQKDLFKKGLKICGHCDRVLSVNMYGPNRRMADGLQINCNDCRRKQTREYHKKNPYVSRKTLYKDIAQDIDCQKGDHIDVEAFTRSGFIQIQNVLHGHNLKVCRRCGIVKELECFGVCNKAYDKLQTYCKQCKHELAVGTTEGDIILKPFTARKKRSSWGPTSCGKLKEGDTICHITDDERRNMNKYLFKRGLKLCKTCLVIKNVYNYYKRNGKPQGLSVQCKDCLAIKRKCNGSEQIADIVEQVSGLKITSQRGGRPKTAKPSNWDEVVSKWKNKEITAVSAMGELNLSKPTFYKMVKEDPIVDERNKVDKTEEAEKYRRLEGLFRGKDHQEVISKQQVQQNTVIEDNTYMGFICPKCGRAINPKYDSCPYCDK